MLTRKTYDNTRKAIFGEKKRALYIWKWDCMKRHLDKMKVSCEDKHRKTTRWEEIKGIAIVWCMSDAEDEKEGKEADKIGHYVVYDRGRNLIYDPLKSVAVNPSKIRRHPKSYLQVYLSGRQH